MNLTLYIWKFVLELSILYEDNLTSEYVVFYDYFIFRIGWGAGFRIFWTRLSFGIGIGRYVWYKRLKRKAR